MGTDIHLCVERRKDDGTWERVLPPEDYCDPSWRGSGFESKYGKHSWYSCRNYDVFTILANVRNGYGFADVDTGDGFVFISEPRGFPPDLSEEVKARVDPSEEDWDADECDVWMGDHSHSWLTLKELQEFDWERTTTHRGVISFEEFEKRVLEGITGPPESYCGGISGEGISTITEAEALAGAKASHVQVGWTELYHESAGLFVEFMGALAKIDEPDRVRIVFGFDS